MTELSIWTIDNNSEEKFLRSKTKKFSFSPKGDPIIEGKTFEKKEFLSLVNHMRRIMKQANGVGLSANQIGLDYRLFVAEVPGAQGENKFYAVLNPEIEKTGTEKVDMEEGCLSVPGTYGQVARPSYVVLKGFDKFGKPVKIKAWGLLARVFQHEVDHLNGNLFIDKAKKIERLTPKEDQE